MAFAFPLLGCNVTLQIILTSNLDKEKDKLLSAEMRFMFRYKTRQIDKFLHLFPSSKQLKFPKLNSVH